MNECVTYAMNECVTYAWVMSQLNMACHPYELFVSRMKDSCHIWMPSCHVWMSHVAYERAPQRVCKDNEGHGAHECVCHVCMSHVTRELVVSPMNESCHICMSHDMRMRYVTYECIMSHTQEHYAEYANASTDTAPMSEGVTYAWVMSHVNEVCHIWMSHVTYTGALRRVRNGN